MPSFNRNDVFTVYLDSDDTITFNGEASFTVTPSGGTTQYSYVSGTGQTLGAYGSNVTLVFTCETAGSYTVNNVSLPVYAKADNGRIMSWVNPDGSTSAVGSPRIVNASKIERMLAKLGRAAYERVHIGFHGMSIDFGVGSNDSTTYTGGGVGRTRSIPAIISKILNSNYGGVFSPGFDAAISGAWAVAGGAAFSSAFASAGPEGRCITLGAGSSTYPVTTTYINQKVRFYAYATPDATPSTPIAARYSLSAPNALALTDAPISSGSPLTPLGTGHWYEFEINIPVVGTTTITLQNPASGGTVVIYGADPDYRTDAGITIHRLARSGSGVTDCCAWALDATDTQPAGNWVASGTTGSNRRDSQFESMTSRIGNTGTVGVGIAGAICSFDVNDIVKSTTYGYTLADHYRHITNYVNKMTTAGIPVLFVCGHLRDPSSIAITTQTQQDIINLYKRVSDESNSVCGAAFLDLSSLYTGSAQEKYNFQWRDSQLAISGEVPALHPGSTGHAKYGSTIGNAILVAASQI